MSLSGLKECGIGGLVMEGEMGTGVWIRRSLLVIERCGCGSGGLGMGMWDSMSLWGALVPQRVKVDYLIS